MALLSDFKAVVFRKEYSPVLSCQSHCMCRHRRARGPVHGQNECGVHARGAAAAHRGAAA